MVVQDRNIVKSDCGRYVRIIGSQSVGKTLPYFGDLAKYEECDKPSAMYEEYGTAVNQLIRERYTIADELAILRQRDTKPEEFAAYNEYAEQCKQRVKDGDYLENSDVVQ